MLIPSENQSEGLSTLDGGTVVKYSRQFQEKLSGFLSQVNVCRKAEVACIVVWYCEEDTKEYPVVLSCLACLKLATKDEELMRLSAKALIGHPITTRILAG